MCKRRRHLKTALRVICLFVLINLCGSSFYVPGSPSGASVKCMPEFIQLTIDRGKYHYLDPNTFRVNDTKSCLPDYKNKTVIIMKVPLFGRCGTHVSEYADMLVFDNKVQGEVYWNPAGISRYPDHVFIFQCSYFRTAQLTLKSFTPDGKIVRRPPTFETGKFKFVMEMFETDKYVKPYTKYPVRVNLNERIFLQIRTAVNYKNLVLFLENCHATLTRKPEDKRNYTLIGDGCPVDQTVNMKQGATTFQRFSLSTFRFLPTNEAQNIYLHCEILMCFKANKQSRCMRDCRTKRSPLVSDNVKLGNKRYMASLGPLLSTSTNDSAPTAGGEVSGSDLGAMVYCDGDYIRLFIERAKYPYIDPSSFTLNGTGEGCNMYTSNKTHVISIIPLDRCGTTVNENADLLTFYNHLNTEVTKTKTGITRHPAVQFKFECSYFRTSTKSLMAFNPIGRIVTRPTAETGKFTFKMDMYQTDKFLSSYTHFPVKVHLKERIFFQVKLKGNTSDLMLFLQNCRATPSDDVNDTIGYDFIKDGCPVDSSLTLKQEDEPKQRFSLSAFRFIPGVRDIFLHCQVLVCHKENKNSRCNTNCTNEPPTLQSNSQILRHRRDLTIVSSVPNITDVGDKKYVASLGPIRILLDEALKPVLLGVRNGTSVINYDWFNLLVAVIIAMAMSRFS